MPAEDNRNKPLQLSFNSIGIVHLASKKSLDQLAKSDEGLFREHILPLIPFHLVEKLYSDQKNGRVARYAVSHVAAFLFRRLSGLTEEKFLAQIPWNLKYQYAIGIDQWADDIPFSDETFRQLKARIFAYNDAHPGEDIWDEITHYIDVKIAKLMNLTTGYDERYEYGLRIDSLMIDMHAAQRPRLDLIYVTMALCISRLQEKNIPIPDEFGHFSDKKDHRRWVYFKGTEKEYDEEQLPKPTTEEEKKKWNAAKRKEAISDHRVNKLLIEAAHLYEYCLEIGYTDEDVMPLLERLINEHVEYDEENNPSAIDKHNVRPDSMQSPFETDATFRHKAGKNYYGYVGFTTEIFDKFGNGIIIDRRLEPNTFSDQSYMRAFQESHDPILDLPEGKRAFISADAGFVSVELNERSDELLHCDVFCGGVQGVSPDVIFADFVLTPDKKAVEHCPIGEKPTSCSIINGNTIKVRFGNKRCATCENKERCGATFTGKKPEKGSSYVMVSEVKITAALCKKMMEDKDAPDISMYLDKRNAIEGVNSVFRRRYEIDVRQNSGLKYAKLEFFTTSTDYNIAKYFLYLRDEERRKLKQTQGENES